MELGNPFLLFGTELYDPYRKNPFTVLRVKRSAKRNMLRQAGADMEQKITAQIRFPDDVERKPGEPSTSVTALTDNVLRLALDVVYFQGA